MSDKENRKHGQSTEEAARSATQKRGDHRQRAPRRQERTPSPMSSRAGAEAFVLETLSGIERPLTRGEFTAIAEGFGRIASRLQPLRLTTIDELDFDARTHLFTALLRAGRIAKPADEEQSQARLKMLSTVGDVWLAVGDESRADEVYEAAGRYDRAIDRLEREGDWRAAAELAERAGDLSRAARLKREHGDLEGALFLLQRANETREALDIAVTLGRTDAIRALAREVDFKEVKSLLFAHDMEALYLELAAELGDWREVGLLYEQAGQLADAAQAYERAGMKIKAFEAFRRAGRQDDAMRLVREEAARRQARGDLSGAGNFLCRYGLIDEAVAIVREKRPELAFKWLEHAGRLQEAQSLATEMVERSQARGERMLTAIWLERCDRREASAAVWREIGKFDEALRLYTALCDWRAAAEVSEAMGAHARAADFYARAGLPIPEVVARANDNSAPLTVPTAAAKTAATAATETAATTETVEAAAATAPADETATADEAGRDSAADTSDAARTAETSAPNDSANS